MRVLVACEESQRITIKLPAKERARVRSITFPGMAEAIAAQWGGEA